jgi:hypothetical protein
MDVALAFAAAVLFAFGTVPQQRVAVTASDEEAARASFLIQLARRPQWLTGIATDGGGLVCQAGALAAAGSSWSSRSSPRASCSRCRSAPG